MGTNNQLHHNLFKLKEFHLDKCEEVKRIIQSRKYSPLTAELRQQEADRIKGILDGLTKACQMDLNIPHFYNKLHLDLAKYFEVDPQLAGGIIILGQDKSESYQQFFRHLWNIPTSYFIN